MISSRSSRNSSTSSMLATVCSSALLLIAFLGNHVTDACSCLPPPDDPCPALLSSNLLVRATIIDSTKVWDKLAPLDANGDPDDPHDQFFTNHYSVKIEEVYVNAGAPSVVVVEGQTIEIRAKVASNLCGMRLQPDMLLDLSGPYLESNVEYFSTGSCSMSADFNENGALSNSNYDKCFENTKRLKGQSYVASRVAPSLGPVDPPTEEVDPPTEEVDPPTEEVEPPTEEVDPPTPTKAQKEAARKEKRAAKKALKKKKKAEMKALKKAQNNEQKIWEDCPRFKPNTKTYACNFSTAEKSCGYGKCRGPSTRAFDAFADKKKCQQRKQYTCENGLFKRQTNKPNKISVPRPICPTSPKLKMMCATNHAPVICNAVCTYSNACEASNFGWKPEECARTN